SLAVRILFDIIPYLNILSHMSILTMEKETPTEEIDTSEMLAHRTMEGEARPTRKNINAVIDHLRWCMDGPHILGLSAKQAIEFLDKQRLKPKQSSMVDACYQECRAWRQ